MTATMRIPVMSGFIHDKWLCMCVRLFIRWQTHDDPQYGAFLVLEA